VFEHPIGIRLNGKERHDVEEYCISEGWVKVPAGRTLDRKGQPMMIQLKGAVEACLSLTARGDVGTTRPMSLLTRLPATSGEWRPARRRLRARLRAARGRWLRLSSARAWPSSTDARQRRLPAIQRDLRAIGERHAWVVEAYALFLAALLLAGGALGDRYGRRRLFCDRRRVVHGGFVACGCSGTVAR
jgi:hypothetical protein